MTPQEIDQLVVLASAWVPEQRAKHRPQSAPLVQDARELLGFYYDAPDLDATKWRVVPELENPPFREAIAVQLKAEGYPAIDFRMMVGITFVDTVVLSASKLPQKPSEIGLVLLHEMAHVVQYRLLGLDRFMHDYVWGLADHGFDYFSIPLEQQAYTIQARATTGERFRVEPLLLATMGLS